MRVFIISHIMVIRTNYELRKTWEICQMLKAVSDFVRVFDKTFTQRAGIKQ